MDGRFRLLNQRYQILQYHNLFVIYLSESAGRLRTKQLTRELHRGGGGGGEFVCVGGGALIFGSNLNLSV